MKGSSCNSNSGACNYTSLANYNVDKQMIGVGAAMGSTGAPVAPPTCSYPVPEYKQITYDALTHGGMAPTCGGYFNIQGAYGVGAENCDTKFGRN